MKFMEKAKRFFTLKRRANDGFTLVELIVVIAILAILAGVAVPAYSGYIEKSKKAGDDTLLAAVNKAFASACVAGGSDLYLVNDAELTVNNRMVKGLASVAVTGSVDEAAAQEAFELFYVADNGDAQFQVYTQLKFDAANHVFVGKNEAKVLEDVKQVILGSNYAGKIDELTGDVGTMIDVLSGYLGQQAIEDVDGSGFGDYMKNVLGMEEKDPDKMANAAVLYLAHTAATMTDENVMMAKGILSDALTDLANDGTALDPGVISAIAQGTGSGLAGYAMLYATAEALAIQQGGDVYANLQGAEINGPDDVLQAVSDVFNSALANDPNAIANYLSGNENSQYSKDMDAYFETMKAVNGKEDELKTQLDGGLLTENKTVLDLINKLK